MKRVGESIFVAVLVVCMQSVALDGGRPKSERVNKFFNIFTADCSLVGNQTRDAKVTVDGLLETMKSIESDPNCKGLVGAVNDLNIISNQLQSLNSPVNQTERTIMGLENRKRELFLMLSQSVSSSEAELIQTEIRSIQLNISEYRGQQKGDFENEAFGRRVQTSQALIGATNAVLNRLSAGESCWTKHPSILENALGLGFAVGQSLAVGAKNPDTALYAGLGLTIMSQVVNYLFEKKNDAQLDMFINGIEATALTCAMEKMSNQYCSARDSEVAIQTVAEALTRRPDEDPVWSSLRLIEKELPNISDWLETVIAGSSPADSATANKRAQIYKKEEKLKSSLDFVQGLVTEKRKFIDSIQDPKKKWIELKSIVSEISSNIHPMSYSTSDISNPLSKRFSKDNGSYFLIGFDSAPMITYGTSRMPIAFDSFEPFGTEHGQFLGQILTVTPLTILDRFIEWHKDTLEVLTAEKNRILIDDPLMVFAKAYPRSISGEQKGLSPRHSLIKILEFMRTYKKSEFSTPSLQLILEDTISRVEEIVKSIDAVIIDKKPPEDSLNRIWNQAKLEKGVGYLKSRIEFFVKTIIESMVMEMPNSDPRKLQLLAAKDVIQSLKTYTGSQSLQKMMDDSKNAQSLLSATMVRFMQTFQEPIDQSLRYYNQMSKEFSEGPSGPHTRSKTIMCLNIATMPKSNLPMTFQSCMGLSMPSVFPGGPGSPEINSATMSLSFESRVCGYRDFHRRNAIFYSFLESGNSLKIEDPIKVKQSQVTLPSYEKPKVSAVCSKASAWKTENKTYCEEDWWEGCDRSYAQTCEPVKKRVGLSRPL